jgi:hypothetical protein
MEGSNQDRWRRLLEAVRHVDESPVDGSPGRIPHRPRPQRPGASAARTVRRPGGSPWLAVRALGALAVLAVGAVHLQQYLYLYSAIPTIGTLFVLNFAGATIVGLALLAPVERLAGPRWGGIAVAALALAAIGLAATAFVFLLIAEHRPLFGFMEPGYDPSAILGSRIAEVATIVLLAAYLVARFVARTPTGRW